jgi:hypothetical protein
MTAMGEPTAGVSLRALLERGRRRGLVTLPKYLAVTLVQQLCRALRAAPPGGDPATLDNVQVGFDGQVRVAAAAGDALEVPAVALVLDELLDETVDPELTRLIGEARRADAGLSTVLSLEQRLGHWQVKQLQLFPGTDLTAALVAWLFPTEANSAPGEAFTEWIREQCTGPVSREEIPAAPSKPIRWHWLMLGLVALGVCLLATIEVASRFLEEASRPPAQKVAAPPSPPSPPPAPRPGTSIAAEPTRPLEPSLPRWGEGVPGVVQLSSSVHGIELETAGFAVSAPWKKWAVKTKSTQARTPRYASLFVAEFDQQRAFTRLSQVGSSGWLTLTAPEVRFFAMQPDQRPDQGTFGLAFGIIDQPGVGVHESAELFRPNVLTDAMTVIEYRRFVLKGLDPKKQYAVLLAPGPRGTPPPVIATATIPKAGNRETSGAGFVQPGAPLDQVLLKAGAEVKVKGVSRLSFVVLTTRGAAEVLATVSVQAVAQQVKPGPAKRGGP